MIDIHAHILPSIDDGARNASETFDMIREAEKNGITEIIATSHYVKDKYDLNKENRKLIIDLINQKLEEKQINIKIHVGAEIFIYPEMVSDIINGEVPTLGESRYVLFELPFVGKVIYLDNIIEELLKNGYRPILAHPERYEIVKENPAIIDKWIEKGVYLQGDISSISGDYGEKAKKIFKKLLKEDKYSFLATDAHQRFTRYQELERDLQLIEKEIGLEELEYLILYNPMQIINSK